MDQTHSCFSLKPRPTDWIKGVNSPIVPRLVSVSWKDHLEFFERQKIGFETNGCVLFTAQESFDAQMDALWPTFPKNIQDQLTSLNYLDTGLDGKLHFHSSPRFLQVMTGNGFNGNSEPDAWDAMRNFGVLPWRDLPYDETTAQDDYLAPIPQTFLDKAKLFLSLIGGKGSIQYHWVTNGAENINAMRAVLPHAPLCLGAPVCEPWDQQVPAVCTLSQPAHSTMCYAFNGNDALILDHYNPFEKILKAGYPIPYSLQGVVSPIFPPPVLPPSPTIPQEMTWLDQLKNWLQNLLNAIKGRNLQSTCRLHTLLGSMFCRA